MRRDLLTLVLQLVGIFSTFPFALVNSLPLVPTTTEFVPLLDESIPSTIVPETETDAVFDDATVTDSSIVRDSDLQFLADDGKTERADFAESISTDPTIVFDTTIAESGVNMNSETELPQQQQEQDQVQLISPESHQEEILNELHTIWNFTNTLSDATESDLKSSLTSLVHFTYDHVVQTPRPEMLGRLKDLLRKLRYKLIGDDQTRSRKKRSHETESGRSIGVDVDMGKDDNRSHQNKGLAEDIQELENFLASPPFSLSLNEIDDSDSKQEEYPIYEDAPLKSSISNTGPVYNRSPPKYTHSTPPGEAVIQKVIHVQDYEGAFPTKRYPTIRPSSSSSQVPTFPLHSKKPKPQPSINSPAVGPMTATATSLTKLPVVSSSGLIQQSSITVQNVSGAIIPLSPEQIANSIINLLYQNHTASLPHHHELGLAPTPATSLPTAPSFFPSPPPPPPNILLLGESYHPGTVSAYLHEGFPQLQQQQQVVNSVYNVIEKEKEDVNKGQGSSTTTFAPTSTKWSVYRPKPPMPILETSTHSTLPPWADHSEHDVASAYDDIKKLIMNLIPTTMSAVLSQSTAPVEEYLTTLPPSIQNDDSSNFNLHDILNRIVIPSTPSTQEFGPEVTVTSGPPPPDAVAASMGDAMFGIAGPGNRRTTTTTESPEQTYRPSEIIKQKVNVNSSSLTYHDNSVSDSVVVPAPSGQPTSSLTSMIEGMTPLTLLNGTKEGIVQVAETFNVLSAQAKIALIFSLFISLLVIIFGFFSIGPPIIAVGALGLIIPLALLVLFAWQTNAVKSGKTLLIDTSVLAGLSNSISKMPVEDFTNVLKLISEAAQKYKV